MSNRLKHNWPKSMISKIAPWRMTWLPTSTFLSLPFTSIFLFHLNPSAFKVPSLNNTLHNNLDSLQSSVKLNTNKNHYHNPEAYNITYTHHIPKYYGQRGSTPALYSGGTRNKSLPRDWLSWQVVVVFLSLSKNMLVHFLKLGHDCFLSHPFQIICYYPVIWWYINKGTSKIF